MKKILASLGILCFLTSLAFSQIEEISDQNLNAETEIELQQNQEKPENFSTSEQKIEAEKLQNSIKYLAAAIAVGVSCIAGGIAVGKIGAAAMGAMSENSELSGKALPFVGLAEGICLWGFLVGLLIIIL